MDSLMPSDRRRAMSLFDVEPYVRCRGRCAATPYHEAIDQGRFEVGLLPARGVSTASARLDEVSAPSRRKTACPKSPWPGICAARRLLCVGLPRLSAISPSMSRAISRFGAAERSWRARRQRLIARPQRARDFDKCPRPIMSLCPSRHRRETPGRRPIPRPALLSARNGRAHMTSRTPCRHRPRLSRPPHDDYRVNAEAILMRL